MDRLVSNCRKIPISLKMPGRSPQNFGGDLDASVGR